MDARMPGPAARLGSCLRSAQGGWKQRVLGSPFTSRRLLGALQFVAKAGGKPSTEEMYLNLPFFVCLVCFLVSVTHPDTQPHLLHRSSQGTRQTQVARIQEEAFLKDIVYIKAGRKPDAASFPFPYPLSGASSSGASETQFPFLFCLSQVGFVGLVLPAPPSAPTITSTTIKFGHHLLNFDSASCCCCFSGGGQVGDASPSLKIHSNLLLPPRRAPWVCGCAGEPGSRPQKGPVPCNALPRWSAACHCQGVFNILFHLVVGQAIM